MSNVVVGADVASPPDSSSPAPGWITWTLRVLTAVTALTAVLQPVTAGLFVTGDVAMLMAHVMVASTMAFTSLLLIVAAILLWRPGGGSARTIVRPVVLFLLVAGQATSGAFRTLEIHFPLAFIVIGLSISLASWAWRDRITVGTKGGAA